MRRRWGTEEERKYVSASVGSVWPVGHACWQLAVVLLRYAMETWEGQLSLLWLCPKCWLHPEHARLGGPGQQNCRLFPTLWKDVNNPKGDYDSCLFSSFVSRQGQHFRYLITGKGKALSNWNKCQTNQNLLAEQEPVCLSRKKDISLAPSWMALGSAKALYIRTS